MNRTPAPAVANNLCLHAQIVSALGRKLAWSTGSSGFSQDSDCLSAPQGMTTDY
jgi:hypothetical protein